MLKTHYMTVEELNASIKRNSQNHAQKEAPCLPCSMGLRVGTDCPENESRRVGPELRVAPSRTPQRLHIRGIVVRTLPAQVRSLAFPHRDGSFRRFDGLVATPHLIETSMYSRRNTVAV